MSENTPVPGPDEAQERTSERVVARECAWCGAAIEVRPRAHDAIGPALTTKRKWRGQPSATRCSVSGK